MTFSETIVRAIKEEDTATIGRIADRLRFGPIQYNYAESYALICRACRKQGAESPNLAEWDGLLMRSER